MIKMDNVVKRFGEKTVLQGVSFTAGEGEIFGLLGPSGAGKTTIINILTRQLLPDSGNIHVGAPQLETGLLLDEDGLYVRLTCMDNLKVFAGIYGMPVARCTEALERVGLTDAANKAVAALSKGMRQRLAIARAILHKPKVLFLDEPTSALDPVTARGIHKLIEEIRQSGTTIFLTTHNMEEATRLCNYVALLHKGQIVEYGEPLEVCKKHDAMKTIPDLEAVFIKLTGSGLD